MLARFRPSPAMVVALAALVVALGGVGYAAVTINGAQLENRSVPGKKLKNNTLGGAEIKESKLGKVPTAAHADSATTATNSTALGGTSASRYVHRPVEAWREVTDTSHPAFATYSGANNSDCAGYDGPSGHCSWQNATFGGVHNSVGFYRDPLGAVHLKGLACFGFPNCNVNIDSGLVGDGIKTIFTLPAGYRPSRKWLFTVTTSDHWGRVDVTSGGDVSATNTSSGWVSLDGITFRAER